LRRAYQLPAVQEYKAQSFALLRPQAGSCLLDVGCGVGEDSCRLAEQVGPIGRITGVDTNPGLIEQARVRAQELALPVQFCLGDIYALDFAANQFDGVRADRVFQHLDHPQLALAEMARVTQPKGWVVVSEPDWETLVVASPDARALTRRIVHYWADSRADGWIGRRLPALFRGCGLVNIEIHPISISGPLTDYDWALDFLALAKSATGAAKAGLISPAEARTWLEHLQDAEGRGLFFAHLSGFIVAGQKEPFHR
jgi:SAM-dependent methyltransferase